MRIKDASDERLITAYIAMRDRRMERKRAYEADDLADKQNMDKVENEMLRRLNERGADSSNKRGVGVAYKKLRTGCSVADWDVFFGYVQRHEAWHLLTHAASKEAVAEFKANNQDLPPGINWTETMTVGFNRG